MGQRGRIPKPRMLRILQGKPGHRRLNPAEPLPEAIALPPPPAYIKGPARELWIELAAQLCRVGLLTKLDVRLFEIYCHTYQRYLETSKFIKEHGPDFVVVNAKGQVQVVRQHPAVNIRTSCIAQMNRLGQELGLSPASRSKFTTPGVPSILF